MTLLYTHITHFDEIHSITLSCAPSPNLPFLTSLKKILIGFHYDLIISAYNVHQSFSAPFPFSLVAPPPK
jgi:hypothetical protein